MNSVLLILAHSILFAIAANVVAMKGPASPLGTVNVMCMVLNLLLGIAHAVRLGMTIREGAK